MQHVSLRYTHRQIVYDCGPTLLQHWICCILSSGTPANTCHLPNTVSMLSQRFRRWPDIEIALGDCPMFAWTAMLVTMGGGPRVVVSTAAFHARVRGSVPGLGGLKETKLFLPHPRVKVSIVGSLRDREVACSASDRQGSNFESCVWRTVSSQSSHHPQKVLLAQFSLYVHKGGLKPDSFHFISFASDDLLLPSPEKSLPR